MPFRPKTLVTLFGIVNNDDGSIGVADDDDASGSTGGDVRGFNDICKWCE